MSAFTNAISRIEGFLGFVGDEPTTEEEYNVALAATDNNMEGQTAWFSGDAPTWAEIQAKIVEQQNTTTGLPAVTGKQKLLDLGLTEEEITALMRSV